MLIKNGRIWAILHGQPIPQHVELHEPYDGDGYACLPSRTGLSELHVGTVLDTGSAFPHGPSTASETPTEA